MINPRQKDNLLNHSYRLLLLDIDGTIAKNGFIISDTVRKAIRLINRKITVSLITGRSATTVLRLASELNLDKPQTVEAGSRIISIDGKDLWFNYLTVQSVSNIIKLAKTNNIVFNLCISGYTQIIRSEKDYARLPLNKVTRLTLLKLTTSEVNKAEILFSKIPQINLYPVKSAKDPQFWHIDITDKKANKKLAVSKLREILKIKREETIGVGDDYNDIPFIKETGLKVAMGNAVDELKQIADLIVPPVSEDGLLEVFKLIERSC